MQTTITRPRPRYKPGPCFNIKVPSYQYRKSHCGDKTVVRSSYLHNGISYTGKMTSLYWFSPLVLLTYIWDSPPVAYFTKEVNPSLAKPPLDFNGSSAKAWDNFLNKTGHLGVGYQRLNFSVCDILNDTLDLLNHIYVCQGLLQLIVDMHALFDRQIMFW